MLCWILSFIEIKGDSLVPLSGRDDLVIHLFLVHPGRKSFSYIIVMNLTGPNVSIKHWMRYKLGQAFSLTHIRPFCPCFTISSLWSLGALENHLNTDQSQSPLLLLHWWHCIFNSKIFIPGRTYIVLFRQLLSNITCSPGDPWGPSCATEP